MTMGSGLMTVVVVDAVGVAAIVVVLEAAESLVVLVLLVLVLLARSARIAARISVIDSPDAASIDVASNVAPLVTSEP